MARFSRLDARSGEASCRTPPDIAGRANIVDRPHGTGGSRPSESSDPTSSEVTLVREAIDHQADRRHFVRVTHADGRRIAAVDGQVIADSAAALVHQEVRVDV